MRSNFIRLSMALVAGLVLSACGGEALEEGPLPAESEDSHTASYIPRCDGTQAWRIDYFSSTGAPIGRMECVCPGYIYRTGTTSGNSQLYYEGACGGY
jgi:hypothetical protein